jgi:lactoylglutathione lyase
MIDPSTATPKPNVEQAVPFFMVTDMEASLRYYVDGLGFTLTNKWIDEGRLRWCWLQIDKASLMLQEYRPDRIPKDRLGEGISICFQCKNALAIYRKTAARGVRSLEPFVGNSLWVTTFTDPDGYRLHFESPTDVPEETKYTEVFK